jgi:VWFA-related protein
MLLLAGSTLFAQKSSTLSAPVAHDETGPASAASLVFKGGVDLVALSVVVTNGDETPVKGLDDSSFAVYEDGVRQDISFFTATPVALDLALVLDTSASMYDSMTTMQEAATGFSATLRPGDRITIIDMKERIRILHPLDGNIEAAQAAIRATAAKGRTALYNGLYVTIDEMLKRRRSDGHVRRQAIAVLSDGVDTASVIGCNDVLELAKRTGIAVYTITLNALDSAGRAAGRRAISRSDYNMKALAQETGGRWFFPAHIVELAGVYASIATELSNTYTLGYVSKNLQRDGTYRRIAVQLPGTSGLRARTRSGYIAARAAYAGTARLPREDAAR